MNFLLTINGNVYPLTKNNTVFHCKTQEQAYALFKELRKHGFDWVNNVICRYENWDVYEDETCYRVEQYEDYLNITYADLAFYKYSEQEYNIVEFDKVF